MRTRHRRPLAGMPRAGDTSSRARGHDPSQRGSGQRSASSCTRRRGKLAPEEAPPPSSAPSAAGSRRVAERRGAPATSGGGGALRDSGKAVVHAMGGTVLYRVNPQRRGTDAYNLKVLTVVSQHSSEERRPWSDDIACSVGTGPGQKRGSAGLVSLTYRNGGGQLVTSNGH